MISANYKIFFFAKFQTPGHFNNLSAFADAHPFLFKVYICNQIVTLCNHNLTTSKPKSNINGVLLQCFQQDIASAEITNFQ